MFSCCKRQEKQYQYNIPCIPPSSNSETSIYRHINSAKSELYKYPPNMRTLKDFWNIKFANSSEDWFLGKREFNETPQMMQEKNKKAAQGKEKYLDSLKDDNQDLQEVEKLFPTELAPTLKDKFSFMKTCTIQERVKHLSAGLMH